MVKLRLKRLGRKGRPFYRIVAMTDHQPRSGDALAELGTYDPVHARFTVDEEAAIAWLDNGARMTPTVHDLFHSQGLLARWRGYEGRRREDALKRHKPKRHKKLAASPAAAAADAPDTAPAPIPAVETPAPQSAEAAPEKDVAAASEAAGEGSPAA